MGLWPKTWEGLAVTVRAYLDRHWQKALRVRQKLVLSEEALHLLLAGGVGVIGGLVNLAFYSAVEGVQDLFSRLLGHPLTGVVTAFNTPFRVLAPMLGGLGAGLILYYGVRFAGKYRTTNLLEVVVAGDGRLPFRGGSHPHDFFPDQHQHGGVHRTRKEALRSFRRRRPPSGGNWRAGSPIGCGCWWPAARRRGCRRPTTRRSPGPFSPRISCWAIFP